MVNNNLTNFETFILLLLLISVLIPFKLTNKFNKLSFINPLIIFSLIISYYSLITPIARILKNETFHRGLEFRGFLIYGWIGSLVLVISTYFGYFFTPCKSLKKYRVCNLKHEQLWTIGFILNIISIILVSIDTGFSLIFFNPIYTESRGGISFLNYDGAFSNYFEYAIDFLISGTILMVTAYIKNKKKGLITITTLIITLGLYLNSGFRYKLLLVIFPIFLFYFIVSNLRPKLYFLYFSTGLFLISLANSVIELTRNYGKGLDFQNLKNLNLLDIFVNFFVLSETSVFLVTSGIMSIIPSKVNYVYFYPFLNVIKHPIPSQFLRNKNSADYLDDALFVFFQSKGEYAVGAAIHNYGEYFLMFGWIGIIIGGYVLGTILKKLWIWILIHEDEDIALPIYLLNISYLFIVISRGYLPMQFLLYFFSVFPLYLIYILNRKKIIPNYIK